MSISCKLSTLMGRNRFTIQDVFEKTGLARSTISTLYHDKAKRYDVYTIDKLCKLFNCPVEELIEWVKE